MISKFASLKLLVTGISLGIVTVFLPCARVVASDNGAEQTFYSSVFKSYWGPFVVVFYITALFLTAKDHPVIAVIAGFLGGGLEAYCGLTKISEACKKLADRGYTIVKSGTEYGSAFIFLALCVIIISGVWALAECYQES